MTKTIALRRLANLTDTEVMAIINSHDEYRKDTKEYENLVTKWENTEKLYGPYDEGLKALNELVERTLMTEEEFLQRFREIVPLSDVPYVNKKQAAAIYNLRWDYERLPPTRKGKRVTYKTGSVQMQTRGNVTLVELTEAEKRSVYGTNYPWRMSIFRLEDVLNHTLTRWPAGTRNQQHPKQAHGRPRRTDKLTARQRRSLEKRVATLDATLLTPEQLEEKIKEFEEALQTKRGRDNGEIC